MFWVFLLLAFATVIEVLSGRWGLAVLLYLLTGLAWATHDRRRSPGQMPMMASTRPLAFVISMSLLWPLRAATMASETRRKLRDPERYLVSLGSSGSANQRSFSKWVDALAFARRVAANQKDGVVILDNARERRGKFSKEFHHVMYMVDPSGEIREIGL